MEIGTNLPIISTTSPSLKPAGAEKTKIEETNSSPTTETDISISDNEPDLTATAESSEKAAGVIRKLQTGHFKGVADVRLRINFNDQLQALQQEKTAQVIDAGIPAIIDSQQSEVTSFLEANSSEADLANQITNASQAFSENMEQIASDYQSQDNKQAGDLAGQLQASFDNYIAELGDIAAAQQEPELPTTDESVTVEMADAKMASLPSMAASEATIDDVVIESELLDISQLIGNLTESFNRELENLVSDLANSSVLPEISEPSGNGRPFDKFMKIYNNLNALADQHESSESEVHSETEITSGAEQISILAR